MAKKRKARQSSHSSENLVVKELSETLAAKKKIMEMLLELKLKNPEEYKQMQEEIKNKSINPSRRNSK